MPVLSRVRDEVNALTLSDDSPRIVILDLCSGFGYLAMFLSELLPKEKVGRLILVDIMWAPQNVTRKPHHIDPEHLHDASWPIPMTTSRADLKVPSDRRASRRRSSLMANPLYSSAYIYAARSLYDAWSSSTTCPDSSSSRSSRAACPTCCLRSAVRSSGCPGYTPSLQRPSLLLVSGVKGSGSTGRVKRSLRRSTRPGAIT